jgi:orotate phosphoribosyltransferase
VFRFGSFVTKAGRDSPYFFNTGLFDDGASFRSLCGYYADAIRTSGIGFDVLFGLAYKGIPLAAGTAIRLSEDGVGINFAFNRKETKDHGEGGMSIGAPLKGRVLIIDDVISAGTSVREAVEIIHAAGAVPAGVVVALDRMERGGGSASAVEEVSAIHGIPVVAVATVDDLITYLGGNPELAVHLDAVKSYRKTYGTRSTY